MLAVCHSLGSIPVWCQQITDAREAFRRGFTPIVSGRWLVGLLGQGSLPYRRRYNRSSIKKLQLELLVALSTGIRVELQG